MRERQSDRRRSGPTQPPISEWIGGTISLPISVTDEGEPYRPEALFWLNAEGAILGSTMARPGEVLPLVTESLRSAIEQPMFGRPHAPTRVRVPSPELADALRAGHPGLDVVCAPTPELDDLAAALREKMLEDGVDEQSYLLPGIGPEAVAALFRAAAGLFRAKPWKTVPSDQSLFSVAIEQLGVRDAAMSVIGQAGENLGFVLFSSLDDFAAFLDAADAVEHDEEPEVPPHLSVSFERGAELPRALRKEIVLHRWEVAAPNAYPRLNVIDADLVTRPPTAREVMLAEAIALALTEVLDEKRALRAAWRGGEPLSRTLSVHTHQGAIAVTLGAPFRRTSIGNGTPRDVLAELTALARQDREVDTEARAPLEDVLMRRFAAAPEAKGLGEIDACRFVMDFAADYFGETIATLGSSALREILFEIIPRQVSIEASRARWIIEVNRAFYSFLKREHGLRQAESCLRVLGGDAIRRLEAALSDPSKFGMAKSLVMAGHEAGFDMSSREGLEAWMRVGQGELWPPTVRLSSHDVLPRASKQGAKARKDMRKAARKARKRNR